MVLKQCSFGKLRAGLVLGTLALLSMIGAACSQSEPAPTPTPTPTGIATFAPAPTPLPRLVDIRLLANGSDTGPSGPGAQFIQGQSFAIDIMVEPNGQKVSAADVFTSFDPRRLTVLDILPGDAFEQVLRSRFDNTKGQVDYGAASLRGPRTDDFLLARLLVRATEVTGTFTVELDRESPRATQVAQDGQAVLDELLPLILEILPRS